MLFSLSRELKNKKKRFNDSTGVFGNTLDTNYLLDSHMLQIDTHYPTRTHVSTWIGCSRRVENMNRLLIESRSRKSINRTAFSRRRQSRHAIVRADTEKLFSFHFITARHSFLISSGEFPPNERNGKKKKRKKNVQFYVCWIWRRSETKANINNSILDWKLL